MKLRKYQSDLIDEFNSLIYTKKSICIQLPTGGGKTIIAKEIITKFLKLDKPILIIVHRKELLDQMSSLLTFFELNHSFISAGYPFDNTKQIFITMVQSFNSRSITIKEPSLIIYDEAHHIRAESWEKIYELYPNSFSLGLTATPSRLDGRGLGKIFNHLIRGPTVKELIESNYLSKYKLFRTFNPGLLDIEILNDDYNTEQLESIMNDSYVSNDIVRNYELICKNKKAIVFCVSIKHSELIKEAFELKGYKVAHLDGSFSKIQREEILSSFRSGKINILTNVNIIGEGFDLPDVDVAILARPTQSIIVYLQQIGRCLRPTNTKEFSYILDHSGNSYRHGLPDDNITWSIYGLNKLERAQSLTENSICNKCKLVYKRTFKKCPNCNLENENFKEIIVDQGIKESIKNKTLQKQNKLNWVSNLIDIIQNLDNLKNYDTVRKEFLNKINEISLSMNCPESIQMHIIEVQLTQIINLYTNLNLSNMSSSSLIELNNAIDIEIKRSILNYFKNKK